MKRFCTSRPVVTLFVLLGIATCLGVTVMPIHYGKTLVPNAEPNMRGQDLSSEYSVKGAVDEADVRGTADALLRGSPNATAEAIAKLRDKPPLGIEVVTFLLPNLGGSEGEIQLNQMTHALAARLGMISPSGLGAQKLRLPKRPLLLYVLADTVRETRPDARRNEAQRVFLERMALEYSANPDECFVKAGREAVFFTGCVKPEQGVQELVSFLDACLASRHGDPLAADCALAATVSDYLSLCVSDAKDRQKALEKYAGHFGDRFADRLKRQWDVSFGCDCKFDAYPESEYWHLADMSPVELVSFLRRENSEWFCFGGKQWQAAFRLAGTRQLRRQNFGIVLPLLRNSVVSMGGDDSLLGCYFEPIPDDATDEEKRQFDIVIAIAEEKYKNDPRCKRDVTG